MIDEQREAWERERSFTFAADFLSGAVSIGRPDDAREAAKFVLQEVDAPRPLHRMALRALGHATTELESKSNPPLPLFGRDRIHKEIHDARRRLREEPRNGILWVDLARSYERIALWSQAEDAMLMALRLFPLNRFVLRSASRMFIHHGDVDRGHDILRRCPAVKSDPWLLAAEIAAASINAKASALVKHGLAMLDDRRFGKFHLSELASAIGTVDLILGNPKKGKRLIMSSLEAPTDNSVAQAAWVMRKFKANEMLRAVDPALEASHEAQAWRYATSGKWHEAVAASKEWLYDEPISTRPACLGSYLASVALADYNGSIRFADQGLVANPDEFTLLNNKTVALAYLGRLDEARDAFSRTNLESLGPEARVVWMATSGLLTFRAGNHKEGGVLYQLAIEAANRLGDHRRAIMALAHLALEEDHAGLPSASMTARKAIDDLKVTPVIEAERITRELSRIAEVSSAMTLHDSPKTLPPQS